MVKARFRCMKVSENYCGNATSLSVELQAVWEPDGPNKSWSEATPSGELKMQITNPACVGYFKPGKVYELDFKPVEG